jgi:hypothetical protein
LEYAREEGYHRRATCIADRMADLLCTLENDEVLELRLGD